MISSISSSDTSSTIGIYGDAKEKYQQSKPVDFSNMRGEVLNDNIAARAEASNMENQKKLDDYLLSRNPAARNENGIFWTKGGAVSNQNENGVTREPVHTTSNGTSISLSTIQNDSFVRHEDVQYIDLVTSSGLHIQFQASQNARITEQKDGNIVITLPDFHQRVTLDPAGNSTFEQIDASVSDSLEGTDDNDIFINVDKSSVEAGDGDDVIINFAGNAVINAGGGDDAVYLGGLASNVTVDTGSGKNSVRGRDISQSQFNLGGDDTVDFSSMSQSNIRAEGDNVHIRGTHVENSVIASENSLEADIEFLENSSVSAQKDANITMSYINSSSFEIGNSSTVHAGDMQSSTIQSKSISFNADGVSNSSIQSSSGDSIITLKTVDNTHFDLSGKTDATFNVISNSSMTTGNEDDRFRIINMVNSSIDSGGGDDIVETTYADWSHIQTGDGNDSIIGTDFLNTNITTGIGQDKLFYWNLRNVSHDLNATTDKAYKISYVHLAKLREQFVNPQDLPTLNDVTDRLADQKEHIDFFF